MALEAQALSVLQTFVRQYCGASEVDGPVLEYLVGAAKDFKPADLAWVDTVQQFLQPAITGDELKTAALTLLADIHNPSTPLPGKAEVSTLSAAFTRLRADAPVFVPKFISDPPSHSDPVPVPAAATTQLPTSNPHNHAINSSAMQGHSTHTNHSDSAHSASFSDSNAGEDWSTVGPLADIACSDEQAVALLSSWFPSYSRNSLLQIYLASGSSLAAAVQDVTSIEQEAAVMGLDLSAVSSPPPASPPASSSVLLDSSAFPELSATAGKHSSAASTPVTKSFAGALKTRTAAAPAVRTSQLPAPKPARPPPKQPKDQAVVAPWVTTGEAVSREYAGARADARDLARLRNVCFQQATLAYLSGQKALARELSDKGRKFAEQMQAAHAEASSAIFSRRNAALAGHPGSSGSGRRFLDLHGLHVAEARSALQAAVAEHRRGAAVGALYVIVGTGHHTKGSRTPARLPAAVQAMLQELRLGFREIRPGMLQVDV